LESFNEFIAKKSVFYKDFEFDSVVRAYKKLRHLITPKYVVHIVGTNGKGSTGRALAHMLWQSNKSVTHYTSPHITKLNERIWINGSDIDEPTLEKAHRTILENLDGLETRLSYFEYLTLVALVVSSTTEYLVLEAGLGGEFDATNVITSDITVLTPVGFDHEELLGITIEKIATTKIKACDNLLVIAKQPYAEVYDVADTLFANNIKLRCKSDFFIPGFLGENIQCAIKVYELLGFNYDKKLLEGFMIEGRVQKIAPNIVVDVGHNPLAAEAIASTMQKGTVLVYNSMKDKNVHKVLQIFKPYIKRVEILPLQNERVISQKLLQDICKELGIECKVFSNVSKDENYLVFGSFFTVEKFLAMKESN